MDDFDDQIKQTTKNPWYAVRTFNCQELKISDFLKERKKVHFVPMTYVEPMQSMAKVKAGDDM